MSDLVLVAKKSVAETLNQSRTGRKAREVFAIRSYLNGKAALMVVPAHLVQEGDRAEFYQSEYGFAIKLTPAGDRSVSHKKNSRTVNIPVEIKNRIVIPTGTTDLQLEDRGDRLWYFPFAQFAA